MQRRAAFLLPDLGGGGAERLTLDLMAGFLARGSQVDLVVMAATGAFLPLVPAGVRVIDLKVARLRNIVPPLRRYLEVEQPDALLAAMWPLTTMAVLARLGLRPRPRLIVSDHCALLAQYRVSRAQTAWLRTCLRLTYPLADGLVAVSGALADEIAGLGGIPRRRVTAIWNPIPPPLRSPEPGPSPWEDRPGKRVLAIGAFKAQKNFSLLLHAFARLSAREDAVLAIVGEGSERPLLEALITELGLRGRVLLPGFTPYPGDWYAGADLFVLPSDYEGFGNVLVEAMHGGLPVVATDCPHGPAEVLGHGRWGTLTPCGNPDALAEAMQQALAAPPDPQAQRTRAAEFSVERAVDAYWQMLFPA